MSGVHYVVRGSNTDRLTEVVLIACGAQGMSSILQSSRTGHVAWGEQFVEDGSKEGVSHITVYDSDSSREWYVTIEADMWSETKRHWNLGYAIRRPERMGTVLHDAAYGFVNGYPLKDIAWFVMTRRWGWFKRRRETAR